MLSVCLFVWGKSNAGYMRVMVYKLLVSKFVQPQSATSTAKIQC